MSDVRDKWFTDPFDYRYGFPMMPSTVAQVEAIEDEEARAELLRRLEAATVEALTQHDIDRLPTVLDSGRGK